MKTIQPLGNECPNFWIDEGVRDRISGFWRGGPPEHLAEAIFYLWAECRSVIREDAIRTKSGEAERVADKMIREAVKEKGIPPTNRVLSVQDLPVTIMSKVAGKIEIRRKHGQKIVACIPDEARPAPWLPERLREVRVNGCRADSLKFKNEGEEE